MPRTWQTGMMEYGKVGFQGSLSFKKIVNFLVNVNFSNNPPYHFPITRYSIIPTFQYFIIPYPRLPKIFGIFETALLDHHSALKQLKPLTIYFGHRFRITRYEDVVSDPGRSPAQPDHFIDLVIYSRPKITAPFGVE